MENIGFKIETVTSTKLKGTTWEDVDVGDIAMIFISYGRAVSHLQFLYVKDGKFSLSGRHGDLIENLEIVSFIFCIYLYPLLKQNYPTLVTLLLSRGSI